MNTAVVAASICLALVLSVILAREIRMRRALQFLLARMLTHRNKTREDPPPNDDSAIDPADDGGLL